MEVDPVDVVNISQVDAEDMRMLENNIRDLAEGMSVRNYEFHKETRRLFLAAMESMTGEARSLPVAEAEYLSYVCMEMEAYRVAMNPAVQKTLDATIKVMCNTVRKVNKAARQQGANRRKRT
jgi:hypothetical protein